MGRAGRVSTAMALMLGAALLLAACGADDESGEASDQGGPDAEEPADADDVGVDEAAGGDAGAGALMGDGACALLDPEGLVEYHDFDEFELVGADETDEGYEACQWKASGGGVQGMTYTATIIDPDDPWMEGATPQEAFDAYVETRVAEDDGSVFLREYDDDEIDVAALDLVDDARHAEELYVLSGEQVFRLAGNPFSPAGGGRLIDGGYFPAALP